MVHLEYTISGPSNTLVHRWRISLQHSGQAVAHPAMKEMTGRSY